MDIMKKLKKMTVKEINEEIERIKWTINSIGSKKELENGLELLRMELDSRVK